MLHPMPDRTNPRHPAFDYRRCAAYFVTICTHDRRRLFGAVRRGRMGLNAYGKIVAEEWERSEVMRDEIVLDAFVRRDANIDRREIHEAKRSKPPPRNRVHRSVRRGRRVAPGV